MSLLIFLPHNSSTCFSFYKLMSELRSFESNTSNRTVISSVSRNVASVRVTNDFNEILNDSKIMLDLSGRSDFASPVFSVVKVLTQREVLPHIRLMLFHLYILSTLWTQLFTFNIWLKMTISLKRRRMSGAPTNTSRLGGRQTNPNDFQPDAASASNGI